MVKVNMMCGSSDFGKDWIHIDGKEYTHINFHSIWLDGLNDPVDLIYCSHGIAYFDREEILPLLQAWYKALKPGGQLIISTPDWDVLRSIPQPLTGPLYGKIFNPLSYHKTVYNYHDLYTVLRKAGFVNIERTDPVYNDQSKATYDGRLISLTVKCLT